MKSRSLLAIARAFAAAIALAALQAPPLGAREVLEHRTPADVMRERVRPVARGGRAQQPAQLQLLERSGQLGFAELCDVRQARPGGEGREDGRGRRGPSRVRRQRGHPAP